MATKRTKPSTTRRSFRKATSARRIQKSAADGARNTRAFEAQQRRAANRVSHLVDSLRDVSLADFTFNTVDERSHAVTALNRLLASMNAEIDATKRRAAEYRAEEFTRGGDVYEAEKPARIRRAGKKAGLVRTSQRRAAKLRSTRAKKTKKARKPSKRKS